jgi:ketosteroid isomerase-like protein
MVENLNRQRVLHLLEMFCAGDIDGALAHCSETVELIAPAPIDIFPHMGTHRGKDDIRKTWRTIHGRYSHLRQDVRDIVADGDKVAVNLRSYFTKRESGRIVQFDIAVFYTFRDGRIIRIREIIDTFDLVQQVLERDVGALLTGESSNQA